MLTKEDHERIFQVLLFAEKNPLTLAMLITRTPVGQIEGYVAKLGRYRTVFTIEYQPNGRCRHISFSCEGKPDVTEMNEILKAFGFKNQLESLKAQALPAGKGFMSFYEKRSAFDFITPLTAFNVIEFMKV